MHNNGYDTIDEVRAFVLTELHTGDIDIFQIGPSQDSCIINRHRYNHVGLGDFAECDFSNTDSTHSYLFAGGAKPRVIASEERGEIAYMGICAGCHAYDDVLIGPSISDIQAMYAGNAEAIVSYINAPVKIRADYPEMPAQNYLDAETQLAVAEYLLNIPLGQSQP